LMQSASGTLPTFWFDFGGKTYVWLLISRLVQSTAGAVELSDAVFVSAHSPMRRAVPVGFPVSEPSPAIVLSRYSVPLRSLEYWPAGDVAGQTVKPGDPSTFRFSTSVTAIDEGCAASCCFENAKTCAALKFGPNKSYSLVVM
jgi:hypothetical protein